MCEMPQIMASGRSMWQIMASIFPWIQMLEMPQILGDLPTKSIEMNYEG